MAHTDSTTGGPASIPALTTVYSDRDLYIVFIGLRIYIIANISHNFSFAGILVNVAFL